jgi:hypothetical protein
MSQISITMITSPSPDQIKPTQLVPKFQNILKNANMPHIMNMVAMKNPKPFIKFL